jgi:hypothetical protein
MLQKKRKKETLRGERLVLIEKKIIVILNQNTLFLAVKKILD